jgi:hypothetical protein
MSEKCAQNHGVAASGWLNINDRNDLAPFLLSTFFAKDSGDWLGGLDSNQDNQIQNLMYCQLYDLPAGNKKGRWRDLHLL